MVARVAWRCTGREPQAPAAQDRVRWGAAEKQQVIRQAEGEPPREVRGRRAARRGRRRLRGLLPARCAPGGGRHSSPFPSSPERSSSRGIALVERRGPLDTPLGEARPSGAAAHRVLRQAVGAREVRMWFSDDAAHVPVRMEADFALGPVVVEWTDYKPGRRARPLHPGPRPLDTLGLVPAVRSSSSSSLAGHPALGPGAGAGQGPPGSSARDAGRGAAAGRSRRVRGAPDYVAPPAEVLSADVAPLRGPGRGELTVRVYREGWMELTRATEGGGATGPLAGSAPPGPHRDGGHESRGAPGALDRRAAAGALPRGVRPGRGRSPGSTAGSSRWPSG